MEAEELVNYNKYVYREIELYVDKRIEESSTIQIRVNSYRRKGNLTFRTVRPDFKETRWPQGPE